MPQTQTKKVPAKKTKKPAAKAKTAAKKSSRMPAKKAPAAKTKTGAAAKAKTASAKKTPAKKTSAKKPAAKKYPAKKGAKAAAPKQVKSKLSKEFLDSQLKKLREERSRYMGSAEQLEEEAEALLNDRSTTDIQAADESGEGDTTSYYRELDLTISTQSREVVEQIDEAIKRIKKGTYGICVDTGKPIPKKRLEAIPWAAQTIEAKAGGLRRR